MAARVSIIVRIGEIAGSTWSSISPTRPDVILFPALLEHPTKTVKKTLLAADM